MNDRKWNETDIAIKMAKRALDIPNADPDDDIRTISRQFLRSLELLNAESDKAIDSYRQCIQEIHFQFKIVTLISVDDALKFFKAFGRFPNSEEICMIDAYGCEDAIKLIFATINKTPIRK